MTAHTRHKTPSMPTEPSWHLSPSLTPSRLPPALTQEIGQCDGTEYRITALTPTGEVLQRQVRAPAMPLFHQMTSAFLRDTLINTTDGPRAVADLTVGEKVLDADGLPRVLLWIGSRLPEADNLTPLYRIMTDTFGPGRPMMPLPLGPGARLQLSRNGPVRAIKEMVDMETVIETRPHTPQRLYHLALDRPALLHVAGLYAETAHPGENVHIGPMLEETLLSLFPHLSGPGALHEAFFG